MSVKSGNGQKWNCVILAASRGSDDILARHCNVDNKVLVEINGKPMLSRVVDTILSYDRFSSVSVMMEDEDVLKRALDSEQQEKVNFLPSKESAPRSVEAVLDAIDGASPVLITTADHVLLDHAMLDHFIAESEGTGSDLAVGVARAETILEAYPQAKRTFIRFGRDRISGCNLFAFMKPDARRALEFWQHVERNRKKPLQLVRAFGLKPLVLYLIGGLNLKTAFRLASSRIGADIQPIVMPFANAAVDVDKPEDLELVRGVLPPLAVPHGADGGEQGGERQQG